MKLLRIAVCLGYLAFSSQASVAEIVTLSVSVDGSTNTSSVITLASNDVARVLHARLEANNGSEAPAQYAALLISAGGTQFRYTAASFSNQSIGLPIVTGPATIQLQAGINCCQNTVKAYCTVDVSRAQDQFRPSTAVVIPADAGGPVSIVMESSTDLITWTPATPGTYGTSTQKRFFRIRAERTL